MFDTWSKKQVLSLAQPVVPITYDNYRQCLKRHLEKDELAKTGVNNDYYGTHPFRIGSLSMMDNDRNISPVFIQKSARHKCLSSTMNYIRQNMQTALRVSDSVEPIQRKVGKRSLKVNQAP